MRFVGSFTPNYSILKIINRVPEKVKVDAILVILVDTGSRSVWRIFGCKNSIIFGIL